jgi:TRAP transporter TAXI family solute receptor
MKIKCESCKVWIPTTLIILFGFIFTFQFVRSPPPKEFRIAVGREDGAYYAFALKYKELLAKEGITLHVHPSAGSVEALRLLHSGAVSVALMQSGTAKSLKDSTEVHSLASLFYEPLWVFYRKELTISYLFDLKGKKIAIGEKESGTHALAIELLNLNNVTAENTQFFEISSKQAAEKLANGEIDAAFFVVSPQSHIIENLFYNPTIELMNCRRAKAYTSHFSFLNSITLGEGLIDLEKNIPDQEKTLLSATANLVARKDLHSDLIHLLLREVIKVHRNGGILEKTGSFPSAEFVELPMSPVAERYLKIGPPWLENVFPFWLASLLDRLKIMIIPLITLMIPLLKGGIPLYRWQMRFRIFRWYSVLYKFDQRSNNITELSEIIKEIELIQELEQKLSEEVSVPHSYMGEFYDLRLHFRMIMKRLENRRRILIKQRPTKIE